MKVHMVCPAPPGSRKGNRVTAERWRRLLAELGHHVVIAGDWTGQPCDVLLALHATKSHAACKRYRLALPGAPLIVALTGTDVYRDLPRLARTRQTIRWADRLIGLHEALGEDLPREARGKLRVILQSTLPVQPAPARSLEMFDICMLGHLRHEKDPMRAALALRLLPHLEQVRLLQAGEALSPQYARWARTAMRRDPRYRWLGEIPRSQALRLLASCRLMVISSRMEGGANVLSEAIVNGVPILASDMPGNRGLLGRDYGGYFPVGNTKALAKQLEKAVRNDGYYQELQGSIAARAPAFRPDQEQRRLADLIKEVTES